MEIKLGEKIKSLRKQKNISQEVLAQVLGVTFQAVSKWETGSALPDLALIPAIANFFEVSTDELFDVNRVEQEEKVRQICSKAAELRDEAPAQAEALLRDALQKYPGNPIILNNLLYTMRAPERSSEVVTLCKALVESTTGQHQYDDVRYDALRILAETYHQRGETDLIDPTLEQIPEIYFTKLELVAALEDDEHGLWAARAQMRQSVETTADMLVRLHTLYMQRGKQAEAEQSRRLAKGLIEAFRRELGERFETGDYWASLRELLPELN